MDCLITIFVYLQKFIIDQPEDNFHYFEILNTVKAQFVLFNITTHEEMTCLKVELYGCKDNNMLSGKNLIPNLAVDMGQYHKIVWSV